MRKTEPIILSLNRFIEIFEHADEYPQNLEELEEGVKEIRIVTHENDGSSGQGFDNYVVEGAQLEALKRANENAKKLKFNCEFLAGFTIDQALTASSKIQNWVNEIQSARTPAGDPLSPFEKVVYAMEICTEFYYTKEEEGEDSRLSRSINKVLTGDKIVCQGYANLMTKILTGCGIGCETLCMHRVFGEDESLEERKFGWHSGCLIYLEDKRYNINGFFMCEPTWAARRERLNGAKSKFFKYSFLTIDQAREMYNKSIGFVIDDDELRRAKDETLKVAMPELSRLKHDYEQQRTPIHPKMIQEQLRKYLEEKMDGNLAKLSQMLSETRKDIPTPTRQRDETFLSRISMLVYGLNNAEVDCSVALKRCCEQETDENIISEVKSIFQERNEETCNYSARIFAPTEPFGTKEDAVKFEEVLTRDALPIDKQPALLSAIVAVSSTKGMTPEQSVAHALALSNGYDEQREKFCAEYLTEHGMSKQSREKVLKIISEKEANGEFDVQYPGHGK